jgi:hypothetical protein
MHIYMILQITLAALSVVFLLFSIFSESKQSNTPVSAGPAPKPASVPPARPTTAGPPVPGAKANPSAAAPHTHH